MSELGITTVRPACHPERYSAKDPGGQNVSGIPRSFAALRLTGAALLWLVCILPGCRKEDMADQPKYTPMTPSTFFEDGKSARPLVPGTVPRGRPAIEDPLYAVSTRADITSQALPKLTRADIDRGQQRFNIFCSVCHGRLGDGEGMIVKRGFPHPPSFYLARLRQAPDAHFYNVMSNGYGAMYSYGERVSPADRWRIVGYIRALQASAPNDNGLSTTPPNARN